MADAVMTPEGASKLAQLARTWGAPVDVGAKLAAALAIAALLLAVLGRGRSILGLGPAPVPRRAFLWLTAFSAGILSIVYIAHYLRGGPRIVDATTYYLQGRALSHGDFTWSPLEPTASFRGRFLLHRDDGSPTGVMGGIFPPGYPLLLAIGFGFGAPMVVGPALAAAIVVVTYGLARAIAEDAIGRGPASAPLVEAVARAAALLSVVCGALRYHTADTMSHAATALGIALALLCALRGRAALAGLAVGMVIATRPVSAAPIAAVALYLLVAGAARGEDDGRVAAASASPAAPRARARSFLLATLPGLALLLVAQHAVTGAWLTSSQKMYYALSDGPPGCFRWGLGSGIGCLNEHGEFVAARLPHGYGVLEAAGTTLRRLAMHLLDVANLEPLALLVVAPVVRAPRRRAAGAALALVTGHVLAYAPFYFDGNYPGGGARLFADVLPVEHALLALGVARLGSGLVTYLRAAFAVLALSLAGFAVHASFEHVQLMNRDGGRPMFEPDLLSRLNVTNHALVFVDTDHGFALGHDPSARPATGVVVARLRADDRDRLLYERLDRPTTYLYKRDDPMQPVLVPWAPPAFEDPLRFEAEAEWPALAQKNGFAAPAYANPCARGNRALVLTPTAAGARATAAIALPVPETATYGITPRVVQGTTVPFAGKRGTAITTGVLAIAGERWEWKDAPDGQCMELATRDLRLQAGSVTVSIEADGGPVAVDGFTLKKR